METATAGTLFHAVKIPLNQAFYLLYMYLNDRDDSLTRFSKLLNIRTTSLRAFEEKIREQMQSVPFSEMDIFSDVELETSEVN